MSAEGDAMDVDAVIKAKERAGRVKRKSNEKGKSSKSENKDGTDH